MNLPPVLVFHLPRFRRDADHSCTKFETPVAFPRRLDMGHYVSGNLDARQCEYVLVSVVQHPGSMDRRHYESDIQHGGC
jgi:ubiquitin C-terminal hydrolase